LWYGGSYAFLPVFEPRTETDDAFTEGYGWLSFYNQSLQ
jgi:hypothetical protein